MRGCSVADFSSSYLAMLLPAYRRFTQLDLYPGRKMALMRYLEVASGCHSELASAGEDAVLSKKADSSIRSE
jgi:hypothetical protein